MLIAFVLKSLLGCFFLSAFLLKFLDPAAGMGGFTQLVHTIIRHGLVPENLAGTAAFASLASELLLGIALLTPWTPRVTGYLAALLLAAFSTYALVVYKRQGSIECGCFGQIGASDISWIFWRNSLLTCLCVTWSVLAIPTRPPTAH
ncbi:MAG TPA: MauE/DoxX family redox-associated membrane protein [Phycisphaerales bacterium]|nr:MauE/DoxX family redox-associated membrane protein [Phycisphaerales bacterium]